MARYPGSASGLGALNAMPSPDDEDQLLSTWQSAQDLVRQQTKSNMDMILAGRDRIRDARVGPSRSEQMLAIAAALGRPTKSGSFGETLSNVSGVLLENETAKRVAEEKRQEMLDRYGIDIGAEQLRMATTAADQVGDLYRSTAARRAAERKDEAARNKPVRGIAVGDRLVDPYTNTEIVPPVGTKKVYEGRTYEFLGGDDQYNRKNWKEVF